MKAKPWIIGVLSFVAGVVVTIIGFVVLTIYVSFIRENESEDAEEDEAVVSMVDEATMRQHEPFQLPALATSRCQELPMAAVKKGSRWTDGDVYYTVVVNTGDSIYMEGKTPEDSGMELCLKMGNDSIWRTEGSSCFAMADSPVMVHQIRLADGRKTQLIVAYYDEDWLRPQAILQGWR